MKKIIFLTGTRADYGKLKSIMKRLDKTKKFELYIYVTGMHLSKKFGNTYKEIKQDKFKNVFISEYICESTPMDVALAKNVLYFSDYVKNIKPDLIFVHGDRLEALAGTIVGVFNNIFVAHIEGGEISGTIDDSIRHAISKLAHIHFVSNETAKQRLIQLGEQSNSIYVTGSPDIDIMLSNTLPSFNELIKHYDIPYKNYAILIYHPVTTEIQYLKKDIQTLLAALQKTDDNFVVIYPNNDPGNDIIINEYTKLKTSNQFVFFPSINFEYFLTLLKNAKYIIGNSSAGIMESGIYGIPAIDIGTRQKGRYHKREIHNIQTISCTENEILRAVSNIESYRNTSLFFGNGFSSNNISKELCKSSFWNRDIQKKFQDLR